MKSGVAVESSTGAVAGILRRAEIFRRLIARLADAGRAAAGRRRAGSPRRRGRGSIATPNRDGTGRPAQFADAALLAWLYFLARVTGAGSPSPIAELSFAEPVNRVGKGARFAPSASAKSPARRAHATTLRRAILPTHRNSLI
jgi:hypothetical protein